MFGYRTPSNAKDGEKSPLRPGAVAPLNVRRSIGEWEATNPSPANDTFTMEKTSQAGPAKNKTKAALTQESKVATATAARKSTERCSPPKVKYADRTAEAKACLTKTKLHLSSSRNTKTEIKTAISEATERLYQLVKEAEAEIKVAKQKLSKEGPVELDPKPLTPSFPCEESDTSRLLHKIEQHAKLLAESNERMEELKERMDRQTEFLEKGTYASVAAARVEKSLPGRSTLHSVVVASKDETESGEEVLDRVRKAINAKEGWIKVERVRKAKDRKVIIGLETEAERSKVKTRLQEQGIDLTVEEVKNKDPLLILRHVLVMHTDEDILKALRNQNKGVFDGLDSGENRVEIKYRRRTPNPHWGHIIVSVSPTIWRRAIEIGTVRIDLQRIRVEDQSPLVQCTRCLGFGHGKRFCREPADLCGHCGGPHMRPECPDWLSGVPPACRNCTRANIGHGTQHSAFSLDCPVRKKWDDVARSAVAYC